MYLKRYTIASLLYMLFLGWYVSQFLGFTQVESISLFGIQLPSLPVALLVLLPVIVLYVATVAHMLYYSLKGYFRLRNYEKDYEKLILAIVNSLLLKRDEHGYKTDRYRLLGKVIEHSTIHPHADLQKTDNEKIDTALNILHDLDAGKIVDLKKFNLSAENPLVLKNQKNRIKSEDLTPEAILNKSEKYSKDILEKAYLHYVQKASLKAIEKYQEYITKEALFKILSRINNSENILVIPNESLVSLINRVELEKDDYLEISKQLRIHMVPEERMKLFEILADQHEEAQEAYLYTLFDLEMIDTAKEFMESIGSKDAMKFRAYLALKESGHNFPIDLFI